MLIIGKIMLSVVVLTVTVCSILLLVESNRGQKNSKMMSIGIAPAVLIAACIYKQFFYIAGAIGVVLLTIVFINAKQYMEPGNEVSSIAASMTAFVSVAVMLILATNVMLLILNC